MSRFTEYFPFFGEPRQGPPPTANVLLSRLEVMCKSVDEQRAAVVQWLTTNEPSRQRLARDLVTSRVLDPVWFAKELMSRHAEDLTGRDIANAESLINDDEGWLAAYDLLTAGFDDGWLTREERRVALALAMGQAFSKLSDGVEVAARAEPLTGNAG